MSNAEMERVREELNNMISSGNYSPQELLLLSKKLDELILQCIKEKRSIKEEDIEICIKKSDKKDFQS